MNADPRRIARKRRSTFWDELSVSREPDFPFEFVTDGTAICLWSAPASGKAWRRTEPLAVTIPFFSARPYKGA